MSNKNLTFLDPDINPVGNNKAPATFFDIIFTIIAILASGFSGYTTYLGFSYDLPPLLSVVIAVIIGLGLLIINFKIREYRVEGDNVKNALIAFSIFLVFSFISNTNAIYTYFLQNDIVEDTQLQAWQNFDKGTSMILSAIKEHPESLQIAMKKQKLDIARRNLRDQITDLRNPGLGPIATIHLQEVEQILKVPITKLKPPSRGRNPSKEKFEAYADKLDALIQTQFNVKYNTGKTKEVIDLKDKINSLRKLYEEEVTSKKFASDTTNLMKRDLDSLVVKAKMLFDFKSDVPEINITADDIGSFQYTWTNFADKINISAIVLSILLSLMLDILTPVLSLLLYKQEMVL